MLTPKYNLYSHLSVSITPNGETIAVGNSGGSRRKCNEEKGLEGSVTVYDVRGNHLLPNGTIDGRNAGDQLGFSVALGPNGDTLAILQRTEDNSIHFFGYRGEQWVPISDSIGAGLYFPNQVVLDPTGNFLVTSSPTIELQVYSKECK